MPVQWTLFTSSAYRLFNALSTLLRRCHELHPPHACYDFEYSLVLPNYFSRSVLAGDLCTQFAASDELRFKQCQRVRAAFCVLGIAAFPHCALLTCDDHVAKASRALIIAPLSCSLPLEVAERRPQPNPLFFYCVHVLDSNLLFSFRCRMLEEHAFPQVFIVPSIVGIGIDRAENEPTSRPYLFFGGSVWGVARARVRAFWSHAPACGALRRLFQSPALQRCQFSFSPRAL